MNLGGAIRVNKTSFIVLVLLLLILVYYYNKSPTELTIASTENDKRISLLTALSLAIAACKSGGMEVVHAKNQLIVKNKGKTKEGANDSYTTADINSHCAMTHMIKERYPTVNLISEEHRSKCDEQLYNKESIKLDSIDAIDEYVYEKDVTIWVDPLDATQEYTEQLHQYVTTMVCIAVKGRPIIGVVHNPFTNSTYWAWVHKKVSHNLENTKIVTEDHNTVVLISRSHAGRMKDIITENFPKEKIEIIKAGGAGYKAVQVATGQADYYLHVTEIKKWDICAGEAILTAVGGRLSTKSDALIDYSDYKDPVNKYGVIASIRDHGKFVGKI